MMIWPSIREIMPDTWSGQAMTMSGANDLSRRATFEDSYDIFTRKRNGHGCMMSIAFIVLFPIGAIMLRLPLKGSIRRVVTRAHAPIQLIGLAMIIGAMGLGLDIAKNDLHYLSPVKAHIVIGLLAVCTIILVQPAMGILQHLHYKKTGTRSAYSHVHRWTGRVAIALGWANSWLGFDLVGWEFVLQSSIVRGAVLMGALGGIWYGLVICDGYRKYFAKKDRLSSYGLGWERGIVLRKDSLEKDAEDKDLETAF